LKGGILMKTSVVTVKGQVVIPATIRKKLGIKEGSKIAFIEKDDKLYIQPLDKNYFESMAGAVETKGKMLRSLREDKKYERKL